MAFRKTTYCLIPALILFFAAAGLQSQTVTFTKTNVTCNGGSDGSITATLSGGTSTYRYVYYKTFLPAESDSFGPTSNLNHTFTGLNPDYYTYFVRDISTGNVLDFNTLQITEPAVLSATVTSTNLTCNGINTGTITISAPLGGSGVYDYTINGGGSWQTSGSYTALAAGSYNVQMRNRNAPACVKVLNAALVISQPLAMSATVTSTNITCFNAGNGSIVISSPSGGSGSYQYSRNGGTSWQASGTFSSLTPGTYNVVMRDAANPTCTKTLNGAMVITQPNQLTVTDISIIKGLTCNEGSDGQLRALVTGGTTPYTFSWYVNQSGSWVSISQTTQTATNLPKGWYEVRVNDANSCGIVTAREFFLEGATDSVPPVFYFDSASVLNTCQGQTNGSITIYAHGGVSPFMYSITTGGASGYQGSGTFSGLPAATYQTWAMDDRGCKKQGPSKTVSTTPNAAVSVSIAANPPGSICPGTSVLFTATPANGGTTPSYQWKLNGTNVGSGTATYSNNTLVNGDQVRVVLTSSLRCTTGNPANSNIITASVLIPVSITSQPASIARCTGTAASFTVVATGTGLTYQWRKGGANIAGATSATYTIPSVVVADAGSYDVVVTGTCGAVTSNAATLTVNTSPSITTQPANTSACVGQSASFTVVATGTGLSYQWRKGGANIAGATSATYTIPSVVPASAGSYDVVITGTCATVTSNAATLIVNTAPAITSQPASIARCTGTAASFTVVATGTGLTYQWRKGGANIAGATSATYTIPSVVVADAGSYDVVVTGTCGAITSNAATLTVNTSPSITTQPANTSACVGQSASFTVVATGTGLSYQWRKGGANIAGATSATYTIPSVVPASAGSYDVVITGTCATVTSNAATLTVNTAPAITGQPASIARCTGTAASFTVVATGTGLTYQWRKGGANIAGATAATYTIPSVVVADAGNYDVVVTGTCGAVTSNATTLTVNTSPSITTQPANTSACVGQSASFTVVATGTGLSYQWRKGGANIPGATLASFTIPVVALADAGSYDVVITGTCATVTSNAATLTVNTAPAITSQPASIARCTGTAASFTVVATGTGLTYQWRKGGANIAGATSATYTIPSVVVGDAGSYDVVITGTCGTITSNAAVLTINLPPSITSQPSNTSACVGQSASFTIVATGPGLTYQWRKGGSNIAGATSATYTIPAVAVGDAGSYDVLITWTCGTIASNAATLTVNTPPAITAQPQPVTACEGSNAVFNVTATGTGLTYQWRKNGINIGGATSATLSLTGITISSAGNYDVVINGTCGIITSNAAALTVATSPVVTLHPADQEVCEGADVSFNITATGTGLTYQWRRNSANLAGQTSASLNLTNVVPAQSGSYDVVVTGLCGTATSNPAQLIVNPATAVISSDEDTLVCVGSDVEFNITANGQGSVTYQWQWYYAGSWIDLSNAGDISGVSTPALAIHNVEAADSGYYRCFVSSSCGSAYSDSMKLDVNVIIATIGTPAPFLINSATTVIQVGVQVTNRFLNWDLGFALVAPDGTEVMLKAPANFPCVFNPFNNNVNVTFTNELDKDDGDTVDYCWNTKLITGTFAATGDWSVLHGMDPANGAWQVRVYDSDRSVPDPDGYLKLASLSFTDLDYKGDTVTINYNSGNINEEILNPIAGELRATPYIVPIRLMTSCFNTEDARAVVTVRGGIAPYTYQWTGPTVEPDEAETELGAGTYSVLVTDAMGCSAVATVEVSSPPQISFNEVVYTDTISCYGDNAGIIRSQADGGTGLLTYKLLPGNLPSAVADSGVFLNLTANNYTIHVSDINGCSIDSTVSIQQRPQLMVDIDVVPVIDATPGSITLTATGGTPPYLYSIDDGATTQPTGLFNNLPTGTYPVYVEDAHGCVFTQDVIVSVGNLDVNVTIEDVSCNGLADGSFILTTTDGTGPYTLTASWLSDPLTDPSGLFAFTGQTAGSYDVRIEDSMGWIFVDNIVINEPSAITAIATTTNARCPAGTLDGAIDVTVSGGSGVYTYQWSNNRTTQDLTGIEAGSYTVQITDNATCTATFNFTVDPDIIVIADAGGDDLVCPYTPFMVCGSPGDSVVWGPLEYFDDPNSQCTMATVPDTTLFTYTVYDKASGCYANDQITIFAFEWFDMQIYDPAADEEVGDVLYLAEGDSYDLEADAGPFATYLWQPDQWITDPTNAAVTISPLGDIKYFVTGTTFNGCIEMDSVQLLIRRPIEIFSGFSPNNDGINDTWVITNAEQYGSLIRIKVFNRWGEPVFESKGYNNDWNGTRNGKPLPVATYYYIIEIEGTKPYTGTVTILR